MKGKRRQGSTLPMVIVTIVLLVAMIGILASIVDTGQTQTQRMYSYLKAKYTATSGTQLAWGAYLEADPKKIHHNSIKSLRIEQIVQPLQTFLLNQLIHLKMVV